MIIGRTIPNINYTDFAGYTVGSLNNQQQWADISGASSGYTSSIVSSSVTPTGKALRIANSTADIKGTTFWNRLGTNLHDQVGIAAMSIISETGNGQQLSVGCLGSGTATSYNGIMFNTFEGTNVFALSSVESGTLTDRATMAFNLIVGTVYWIKWQITGNTARAKIWADGGSEPGSWGVTYTNSTIVGNKNGASGVGLGTTLNTSYNMDTYWYACDVNGSPRVPDWSF